MEFFDSIGIIGQDATAMLDSTGVTAFAIQVFQIVLHSLPQVFIALGMLLFSLVVIRIILKVI